jgi:bifunctional glutamyl/prolyl-tRNA synthetase
MSSLEGSGAAAAQAAPIEQQGAKVRALKAAKASKAEVEAEVAVLVQLKQQYKAATGVDFVAAGQPPPQQKKAKKEKPAANAQAGKGQGKRQAKKAKKAEFKSGRWVNRERQEEQEHASALAACSAPTVCHERCC